MDGGGEAGGVRRWGEGARQVGEGGGERGKAGGEGGWERGKAGGGGRWGREVGEGGGGMQQGGALFHVHKVVIYWQPNSPPPPPIFCEAFATDTK